MYNLLFDEDQTMIADAVGEFLRAELPLERLRPGAKPADQAAVMQGMAGLGWFGIGLPEAAGGSGLGIAEEILVQRECGRHLVTPDVLATVLAGHIENAAGNVEAASRFARGDRIASLGVRFGEGDDEALLVDWDSENAAVLRDGDALGVIDHLAIADVRAEECVDDSVSLARCRIANSFAGGDGRCALRADILAAASLAGLASGACDLAVNYATVREQFGNPIGSFQAIKHRCADMAVRFRLAWYQTCLAALKFGADQPDAPLQAASAFVLASQAARENGKACIQLHGGIGFQAECDAHWFLKRAVVYDLAGGGEAAHIETILAAPEVAW